MAQNSLIYNSNALNKSIRRLSTGYKINSVQDDAAGYSNSKTLETQISSIGVAKDNAEIGISYVDTASQALEIISDNVQRIRDIAQEASNGTYTDDQRNAMQIEVNQRTNEINRLLASTTYGDKNIFQSPIISDQEAASKGYTVIKTADDLANLPSNISGKYILMGDIDMSGVSSFSSLNLTNGSFDGNGHSISGLSTALFSNITNSTVTNMSVEGSVTSRAILAETVGNGTNINNIKVEGNINNSSTTGVGALIGNANGVNIKISQCASKITITGTGENIGGFVGYANGVQITDCSATGTINSWRAAGGLIGFCQNSTITNSTANTSVISTKPNDTGGASDSGGLIGITYSNTTVDSCSAYGSVTTKSRSTGGFIGCTFLNANAGVNTKISNCNSYSNVSSTSYHAGFIGDGSKITITNCNSFGSAISPPGTSYGFAESIQNATIDHCYTADAHTFKRSGTGTVTNTQTSPNSNPISVKNPDIKSTTFATGPINLQVGIDSKSGSTITINTGLLLSLSADITTEQNAQNSMGTIDNVLNQIIKKQTELGSISNRLESASENLDITSNNLNTSISILKDIDIAKESSEFINKKILQQSSAVLLSTANQAPSIALSLI